MTILDQLSAHAKERTERAKQAVPPGELQRQALSWSRMVMLPPPAGC